MTFILRVFGSIMIFLPLMLTMKSVFGIDSAVVWVFVGIPYVLVTVLLCRADV